jgi:hypothetical protein
MILVETISNRSTTSVQGVLKLRSVERIEGYSLLSVHAREVFSRQA